MSDESKGAVTVYETTPRYRIEVSGHSGQPEHPIPHQMVSKADYDALAARLSAAEARVTEAEAWKDAVIDAAVTHESPCHVRDARKTLDAVLDAAVAEIESDRDRLAAEHAAQAREIERLREIVDRLPKTADGVVRLVDDPVWLRYETETTRVIRGRVCYRGDEAVGYFAEDRDGDNFIDWSDEYPVSECFATEDAARRGAVVPRGDSPAAVDPRAALLHIATMDVFTRDGEEPPHETMRRIAIAALAPAADASGEVTP